MLSIFSCTLSATKRHDHAAAARKSRRTSIRVEALDGRQLLSGGLTPVPPSTNPIIYNPPINPPAADPSDTDAPYIFQRSDKGLEIRECLT
jgi:hypothetical protein